MKRKIVLGMEKIFLFGILFLFFLSGASSASYSNVQSIYPGANSLNYNYGAPVELFPSFEEGICGVGSDFVIQVDPLGCSPSVVRSDLLEEQDVPIFCPLSATKINPLINVEAIDYLTFSGGYSEDVAGIGFHPSQAAIKGNARELLNSPILNNIGYAVIVLKQQPNEAEMPDFVEGNLTATLRYDIKNAFGIGKGSFYLPEMSSTDWNNYYNRYVFWNGKGYLRAENIGRNSVDIGVYSSKEDKVISVNLKEGESSSLINLPGFYCTAGLRVRLDDLEEAGTRARISVDGELMEVVEGEGFLDNNCRVRDIDKNGLVERVQASCRTDDGRKDFDLFLSPKIRVKVQLGEGKPIEERVVSLGDKISGVTSKGNNVYLSYLGSVDDSDSEESLYFRFLESVEDKDKLSGSELSYVHRQESYSYESQTGGIISRFGLTFLKGGAALFEEGFRYLEGMKLTQPIRLNIPIEFDNGASVEFVGYDGAKDRRFLDENLKENYDSAMEDYRKVIDGFKDLSQEQFSESYGERALFEAIQLANNLNQIKTLSELCNEFDLSFPSSKLDVFQCKSPKLFASEGGNSGSFVLNGNYRSISLLEVIEPTLEEYSAEIVINNANISSSNGKKILGKGARVYLSDSEYVELVSVTQDSVFLETSSLDRSTIKEVASVGFTTQIKKGESITLGDKKYQFSFVKANLRQVAKISILPEINREESTANFSFKIGIEKRNIQLTPGEVEKRITNLNQSLKDWNKLSEGLDSVVEGFNKACLATGGILTAKNFLQNLDGGSIARKEVMRGEGGWTDICREEIRESGDTMDRCFSKHSNEIDSDVGIIENIIKNEKGITLENACERYSSIASKIDEKSDYKNSKGDILEVNPDLVRAFEEVNGDCLAKVSLSDARDLERYFSILEANPSNELRVSTQEKLFDLLSKIKAVSKDYSSSISLQNLVRGIAPGVGVSYFVKEGETEGVYNGGLVLGRDIPANWVGKELLTNYPVEIVKSKSKTYFVVLEHLKGEEYSPLKVYEIKGTIKGAFVFTENPREEPVEVSPNDYPFSIFRKYNRNSYSNNIVNAEVKYFENEPYKGLPSQVPFNLEEGWYAATKQIVSGFGNIRAYDDSGNVNSFYLCNVGKNGRIEGIGLGDDVCSSFNEVSRQASQTFPGLTIDETNSLVGDAINAIREAANKYKVGLSGEIRILRNKIPVGNPDVGVPDVQCQDFMSPDECLLLFNACDPVVCPTSRCNLGGDFYVDNVIQSGIIGSSLLCLPNIKEGIAVPLCLSGINAGVESYISLLDSYKSCLETNLETGEQVGICDQINSVYMCELFWRQTVPFTKNLVPNLIGAFSGEGERGGGEYLGVQDAWNNAGESIDFFTQFYAKNTFDSFNARSTENIGSALCKNFISVSYPDSAEFFDSLAEPVSPPQYSAWFSEIPFTSASVPPTSQYKVFFHIFSGKSSGSYYNVYLRGTGGSFYQNTPEFVIPRGTGYIAKGDYVTETVELTAPSGYNELCIGINGQTPECGFNRVSSSFAIDYIGDKYASEQAGKTDIKSERECISGSPSAYNFLNPNLQEGVSGVINPEIYNDGIVRVCSSENPGLTTDLSVGTSNARWKEVGSCDNNKGNLKCWLDSESVKDVIKSSSIEGETLGEVNDYFQKKLAYDSDIAGFSDKFEKIKDLKKPEEIISAISDNFILGAILDFQKAELWILRGGAYAKLSKKIYSSLASSKLSEEDFKEVEKRFDEKVKKGKLEEEGLRDDFSSLSFFYDFDGRENLFFRYNLGVWEWSKEDKMWNKVNIPHGDKDKDKIVSKLKGVNYLEGVSVLLKGVIGSTGIKDSVSSGNVEFEADRIFKVINSNDLAVYYRFNGTNWEFSTDNDFFMSLEELKKFELVSFYQRYLDEKILELNRILILPDSRNFKSGAIVIFEKGNSNIIKEEQCSIVVVNEGSPRERVLKAAEIMSGQLSEGKGTCWTELQRIYSSANVQTNCLYTDETKKMYDRGDGKGKIKPNSQFITSSCSRCNQCKIGPGDLTPGDILTVFNNYNSKGGLHNVIFIKWMDESKKIAKIIHSTKVEGETRLAYNDNYNLTKNPVVQIWEPINMKGYVSQNKKWNLNLAIEEIKKRNGDYGDNLNFMLELKRDGVLTEEEVDEIDGRLGIWGQKSMRYVQKLLEDKKAGLIREKGGSLFDDLPDLDLPNVNLNDFVEWGKDKTKGILDGMGERDSKSVKDANFCEDCGKGLLNSCDKKECQAIGQSLKKNCVYSENFLNSMSGKKCIQISDCTLCDDVYGSYGGVAKTSYGGCKEKECLAISELSGGTVTCVYDFSALTYNPSLLSPGQVVGQIGEACFSANECSDCGNGISNECDRNECLTIDKGLKGISCIFEADEEDLGFGDCEQIESCSQCNSELEDCTLEKCKKISLKLSDSEMGRGIKCGWEPVEEECIDYSLNYDNKNLLDALEFMTRNNRQFLDRYGGSEYSEEPEVKKFIDSLNSKGVITQEEFEDITAKGSFDFNEEEMDWVYKLLLKKSSIRLLD